MFKYVHISQSLYITVNENKKQAILREGKREDNKSFFERQVHVPTAMGSCVRREMCSALR